MVKDTFRLPVNGNKDARTHIVGMEMIPFRVISGSARKTRTITAHFRNGGAFLAPVWPHPDARRDACAPRWFSPGPAHPANRWRVARSRMSGVPRGTLCGGRPAELGLGWTKRSGGGHVCLVLSRLRTALRDETIPRTFRFGHGQTRHSSLVSGDEVKRDFGRRDSAVTQGCFAHRQQTIAANAIARSQVG